MTEEAIMINKAVRGNITAFEMLLLKYEKMIYNIAYRMFNNREDACDITQEVCLKFYKSLSKCAGRESVKSWIYTIAYNTCIDEIRKRKKNNTLSLDMQSVDNDGSLLDTLASNEHEPESRLINKEKNMKIADAVNSLPENYRMYIILRDINGLSYKEISEITGHGSGTVKSGISRARGSLRRLIYGQ